ncbi:GSCFA domain-containing protein [Salibacterium aidingense]|uniref:GSCFA domain-containing protein n=1 Tax=Salibacterium aidingense TaxID=384933 RepID=UPI003BC31545
MVYLYNPDRKGLSEVKILDLEPWRVYPKISESDINFLEQSMEYNICLDKSTKIASIGSCFARELKNWLIRNDYTFIQKADGPGTEAGSARYDRVYNTFTMRQEFERAFEEFSPQEKYWELMEGNKYRLLDPYRRMIAWENHEEMDKELREHRENVYEVFSSCDVLIITVGQSEIWYNRNDGYVYPMVPPTEVYNPDIHSFKQSTYEENVENLEKIYTLYKECNPEGKIIITVSPVPLRATFHRQNSIVANESSKSMLRTAVETFVKNHPGCVNYFPAYEIVTRLEEQPYELDNRHIKKNVIDRVMKHFEKCFIYKNVAFEKEEDLKINYFINKSKSELKNGNTENAKKVLQRIENLAQNNFEYYLVKAEIFTKNKEYSEAESVLKKASSLWNDSQLKSKLEHIRMNNWNDNVTTQKNQDENIVFIGGAGRSGTTLLRVMLNAHHSFCSGPEFKLLNSIISIYHQFVQMNNMRTAYSLTIEDVNKNFASFISGLFENFKKMSGAPRIVEKTPHNVLIMKELAAIFPNAKFLHVIRDGRDVASSLLNMNWVSANGEPLWYVQNLENASKYWSDVVRKGIEDGQNPILKDRLMLVKYEDLILSTEETMKNIIEFLGEAWESKVLDYHTVERGFEPKESSTDQVANKINTNALHRWNRSFSEADKDIFKKEAGDLLIKLGYEIDYSW